MPVKGIPRTRRVQLGKHTLEVYTIGLLATATQMARVTLRLWERKKVLPRPILKIPGEMRYYTASEILKYATVISNYHTGRQDLKVLAANLAKAELQLRSLLTEVAQADKCPVEILCLHLPPKPLNLIR